MRWRTWKTWLGVGLVVLLVASILVYRWRTAGHAEARAVTERVAAALAAGDHAALAADPIFHDHPGTPAWLLDQRSWLANGYRVVVHRNGNNGLTLLNRNLVTHVGRMQTAHGEVTLGFRWDRESATLSYVTASASTMRMLTEP